MNGIRRDCIIETGRVYLITNLINNKKYVGITTRELSVRFKEHLHDVRRSLRPLYHAIKKYGRNNFKVELIEEHKNVTEDFLLDRETFNIIKYNTFIDDGWGYNLIQRHTHRLIISESTRLKFKQRIGNKNPFYGKHHTKEAKRKMGGAVVDYSGSNNPFYGKHHTEESKQNSIKYNKSLLKEQHPRYGKHHTIEQRKRISNSLKGKYAGIKNFTSDKTIYTFKNINTLDVFTGNRCDFRQKYPEIKPSSLCALIKNRLHTYKNWKIVENNH